MSVVVRVGFGRFCLEKEKYTEKERGRDEIDNKKELKNIKK